MVFENENGKATYKFGKNKNPMYLIEYANPKKTDLWTNSIDIIQHQLEYPKQKPKLKTNQLKLEL